MSDPECKTCGAQLPCVQLQTMLDNAQAEVRRLTEEARVQGEMATDYRSWWLSEEKRRMEAERERDAAREALREVARRAGLPITPNVTGMPATAEDVRDAIAECARLVVQHVTEPARRALGGEEGAGTPPRGESR
jgi:hypothetical protein